MSATSLARELGASAAPQKLSGQKGAAQQRGGKERSLRERAAAAARHPAGAAALTLAGAYLLARGAAAAFQRTRRRFLRQLLVDLCAALDAIGQPYWLDFGGLLGIYRCEAHHRHMAVGDCTCLQTGMFGRCPGTPAAPCPNAELLA